MVTIVCLAIITIVFTIIAVISIAGLTLAFFTIGGSLLVIFADVIFAVIIIVGLVKLIKWLKRHTLHKD